MELRLFKSLWILGVAASLVIVSCNSSSKEENTRSVVTENNISTELDSLPFICIIDTPKCDESGCSGTYKGVEFIPEMYIERLGLNGTDVAHQYSNKIAGVVGNKLKELYARGLYSKVDFNRIRMTTKGMDSGENYVEYSVFIPFKRVPKAQAMTAFDHCGGWGHPPELVQRKMDLTQSPSSSVVGKRLYISRLFKTQEGLEEYWIQWKHKDFQ